MSNGACAPEKFADKSAEDEPALAVGHDCGHRMEVELAYRHCDQTVAWLSVELVPLHRPRTSRVRPRFRLRLPLCG